MRDLSPGFIASAAEVDSTNVSSDETDSSTPRGSDVVPLVKTIMAVLSTSTLLRCQMLLERRPMAASADLMKKSVLRVPNPPVARGGASAATSWAFSA